MKQFEKSFKNAEASHLVEGLQVPNQVKELLKKKFLGEISQEEYLKQLLELVHS